VSLVQPAALTKASPGFSHFPGVILKSCVSQNEEGGVSLVYSRQRSTPNEKEYGSRA